MPKSSRTRPTPSSLSVQAGSAGRRVADSSTRTLSVISSRRWTGSRPVPAEDLGDRWRRGRGGRPGGPRGSPRRRAARRFGAQLVPPRGSGGRPLLHPAPDRLDQAAVLGDRDEVGRVEQAALGVLPAHQRLEPMISPVREGDHRLVVEVELVAFERVAQLALDLEPAQRPARISASKSCSAPGPRSLARYIAASASRISRSASAGSRPGAGRRRCRRWR